MTTILLDPTLRRARIARVSVAVIAFVAVAIALRSAHELRPRDRAAPTLPSPRRGSKSAGRRPPFGHDPAAGQRRRRQQPSIDASRDGSPAVPLRAPSRPPRVTAFIDPSVAGAVAWA
jgi:hypothetical protein